MTQTGIHTHWIGTFNRKGELMSVDETEAMAVWAAAQLELDPRSPKNVRRPVTIIEGNLLDFVILVLDAAKEKVDERRAKQIVLNARMFKKEEEIKPE